MKYYIYISILLFLLFSAYAINNQQASINVELLTHNADFFIKDDTISDFWGEFNFADSTNYDSKKKKTELLFSNYIVQLKSLSYSEINRENNKLLSKCKKYENAFIYFWGLFEKYYYDPDSPYRNDSLYINILSYIIDASVLSEAYNKAIDQWRLIHKNRVGFKAEDFSFTISTGENKNLYDVKNDYIILYFNMPDCEECIQTKEILESRSNSMKNVSIVAIYPNDDYLLWSNVEYPERWINGYDKDLIILKRELYDLRAFPTIYLLDRNKNVVLKDPSINELCTFLNI